jgi:hypothetical protein
VEDYGVDEEHLRHIEAEAKREIREKERKKQAEKLTRFL